MTKETQQHSSDPPPDTPAGTVRDVQTIRLGEGGAQPRADQVVVEKALTLQVQDVGNFTILCTPCDEEALAVGFAFSEGMIDSADDVLAMTANADRSAIGLRLDDPARATRGRNMIVSTSCGMCGSRSVESTLAHLPPVGDTLRLTWALLAEAAGRMQERQGLFTRTGGTHAAAIFDAAGQIVAMGEDIGRHNALDKAVGQCLLRRLPTVGCGAVLSGRTSFEIVAKAARAGLEVVAAVSAPTSLAVEAAGRCGITLCGFVRPGRCTVYTHPGRIGR